MTAIPIPTINRVEVDEEDELELGEEEPTGTDVADAFIATAMATHSVLIPSVEPCKVIVPEVVWLS